MSNQSTKANSFLSNLLDDDDSLKQAIEEAKEPVADSTEQWIVYYVGDKPDCAWSYHHNPDDDKEVYDIEGNLTGEKKGYGRLEGYWEEDKDNKVARHFVPHQSNNLKLMPFDTFMDNVVPNKSCTKIYEDEASFLLDLL